MSETRENERWSLPETLDLNKSPELLAKTLEWQKELSIRANSPFARLSPQEHARAQALRMIPDLENSLKSVRGEIAKSTLVNGNDSPSLRDAYEAEHVLQARLAEAHAQTGRYDLAASIDPRPAHRDEWQSIMEAVVRDDDETCKCAPGREVVELEIFSVKHNRVMPLIKCSGCGKRTVKVIPRELALQRAHRAKARELVGNAIPGDAGAILRKAGHTSETLLGRK